MNKLGMPSIADINGRIAGSNGLNVVSTFAGSKRKPHFVSGLDAVVENPVACRTKNPNVFAFRVSETSPNTIARSLVGQLDYATFPAASSFASWHAIGVFEKKSLVDATSSSFERLRIRQLARPPGACRRKTLIATAIGCPVGRDPRSRSRDPGVLRTAIAKPCVPFATRNFELGSAFWEGTNALDRRGIKARAIGTVVAPTTGDARRHKSNSTSPTSNFVIELGIPAFGRDGIIEHSFAS